MDGFMPKYYLGKIQRIICNRRYYPEEVEMYQYDNGFKLDKKMNNWEHLQKFFKRKSMPVDFHDYDPVIHCAPDAAYKLLKKFYQILTGRE